MAGPGTGSFVRPGAAVYPDWISKVTLPGSFDLNVGAKVTLPGSFVSNGRAKVTLISPFPLGHFVIFVARPPPRTIPGFMIRLNESITL